MIVHFRLFNPQCASHPTLQRQQHDYLSRPRGKIQSCCLLCFELRSWKILKITEMLVFYYSHSKTNLLLFCVLASINLQDIYFCKRYTGNNNWTLIRIKSEYCFYWYCCFGGLLCNIEIFFILLVGIMVPLPIWTIPTGCLFNWAKSQMKRTCSYW